MSIKNFSKRPLALVTAALISPVALAAETKPEKLEEMVVVGSRIEMPLRQQAVSISVLDAEAIENRGYASLADVLRSQPSIHVSNSGGAGKQTALRIRGEEGFRTKVIIDGIDISDPTATQIQAQMQHITSAGIERVEILRGAQGMAYGADAGGVINISSRRAQHGLNGSATIETGRYGSQQLNGYINGSNKQGDFSLIVADTETDGFNARVIDGSTDKDGYENTTVHFNGGVNFGEHWRLGLTLRDVDADNEYDGFSATSAQDNLGHYEQQSQRIAINYDNGNVQHQLSYSNSDVERENSVISTGAVTFLAEGSIKQTQYLGSWKLSHKNTLVFGLDHDDQQDQGNNVERKQLGAHLEWQSQAINDVFLTAGIRYDDNDDFGKHNSYRISAVKFIGFQQGDLKIKSSIGTGFRAPSLSELAYNNGPYAYGEAAATELKEEQSRGLDLGVEWLGNNGLSLEAVLFKQKITDEILFDLAAYSGYLQTLGDSRSQGVELLAAQSVNDNLSLRMNATYNDTEDSSGQQRRRRPRVLLNLGVDYRWDSADILLSANWRRSSGQSDNTTQLDDYDVLDVRLGWTMNSHVEWYGRLENALDEEYQEISGYNTARAAAYAGVKLSF